MLLAVVLPLVGLGHAGGAPEIIGLGGRVLDALFDLDTFVRLDAFAENLDFADRRVKGLMAAAVNVVDIFANDTPVVEVESVFAEDAVCVDEAVENESKYGGKHCK